ncbi:biotin/lipoyl-binding protein, partial [Serratia marcescens]|uniref:biotin/lipoyl-binding protein n=2 Tax=Pseudomonadota TaxID=1224 RepID=UPI0013D8F2F7
MSKRKLVPLIAGSAAAVVGLVAGGLWWADRQHYEKTDNAYVQADTVSVSPQISGYVAEVLVADNQRVQPGQVL